MKETISLIYICCVIISVAFCIMGFIFDLKPVIKMSYVIIIYSSIIMLITIVVEIIHYRKIQRQEDIEDGF